MSRDHSKVRDQSWRRSGASAVEAAIVLPVALIGLLLMLDLGLAVAQSNSLSDGARHAARIAIVRGADSHQPLGPTAWSGTLDESHPLTDAVRPRLLAMPADRVTLSVTWPDGFHQTGNRVLVSLQYEHPLLLRVLPGRMELSGSSTMRILR